MLILEECCETGILKIHLTTCFTIRKFGNTGALRVNFFFSKCSKFDVDFRNPVKHHLKDLCFFENCISIVCRKFSLLRREYLSSTVSVFTNSLKISHVTKKDILQHNLCQNDKKYDKSAAM